MSIRYPVTVRHAQRAVAKNRDLCIAVGMALFGRRVSSSALAPILARMAAQYGADYVILASPGVSASMPGGNEARIKGTDEVAPVSENPSADSQLHGGDGASGEVLEGLSQGGEKESGAGGTVPDQGTTDAPGTGTGAAAGENEMGMGCPPTQDLSGDAGKPEQSAPETGNTSGGAVNSLSVVNNGGNAEGGVGFHSGTGTVALPENGHENRTILDGTTLTPSTPGVGLQTGAANVSTSVETDEWRAASPSNPSGDDRTPEIAQYRYRKLGGTASSSKGAVHSDGGVTAQMKKMGITPRLVRETRTALSRLVGGENKQGPRYNWGEFCERLLTKQNPTPARKEEDGRPAILVLADVSGSCSHFSSVAVAVAGAAARNGVAGADVVIITHSNGYPVEWVVNQQSPKKVDVPKEKVMAWYAKTLRKYQVEAVVALGDWDAEWLYAWLVEKPAVNRFVWLDSWSSSVIPPTIRHDLFARAAKNDSVCFSTPWLFEKPWSAPAKAKTTYVVGCGTADEFLQGLKLALAGG